MTRARGRLCPLIGKFPPAQRTHIGSESEQSPTLPEHSESKGPGRVGNRSGHNRSRLGRSSMHFEGAAPFPQDPPNQGSQPPSSDPRRRETSCRFPFQLLLLSTE